MCTAVFQASIKRIHMRDFSDGDCLDQMICQSDAQIGVFSSLQEISSQERGSSYLFLCSHVM